MYLLYSLALSLLFVALLPYFIYQAIRHGKYVSSFKQRLGLLPESIRADSRPTVWVHTVSVGEFLAARPLIERIRSDFPDWRLAVSTTTMTGQRLARSQPSSFIDCAFYFPFDWGSSVRRALAHVKPQVVIILERELWPNFLRECRRRDIKVVIANGRISERSFSRYNKVRRFVARLIEDISLLVMQSRSDAERVITLGAQTNRVRVCGNLKYDVPAIEEKQSLRELDYQLALSSSEHLIIAGSTMPGEEEILLAALTDVRKREELKDARLIIAPRHPERFNEVASLIAQSGFKLARRSDVSTKVALETRNDGGQASLDAQSEASRNIALAQADVILLDTIGELALIYKFASVVFVGGSLVPRGGHNIIEPAAFAKPILVGPHTENFRQIISDFAEADALVEVSADDRSATALTGELIRLLSDREAAQKMGARALEILCKNRGATDCTMAAIKELMKSSKDDWER